ncbi:MAG: hypothetical protein H0U02_12435 [Rubrobacter sp.]|nr:hypothetical protein [Rubrobacter sp.]
MHGGDGPDSLDTSDGLRGNDAVYGGAGWDACSRDTGGTM